MWNGTISLTPFDLPEALKLQSKKASIHKNKRIFGRSIDKRAEIAASREEICHWEIDTVVGKNSGNESVVLTIVEKATDFYIAMKIPGKDPLSVMTAMEVLIDEYGENFSTVSKAITYDNRTEFSELSNLEKHRVLVYFAHPCSSWERTQNERHNCIFRRFVPKGISIDIYFAEQVLEYADSMYSFPRKILGYMTPE